MSRHVASSQSEYEQGFTLLELLVALGLIGIVMTAVLTLNVRTGSATSALQARAELTSETQIAQNYIAGKLRNAVYVYPYGTSAAVSYFQMASTGYSTFNPSARAGLAGSGNYNWRYGSGSGSDPFIAFILPPQATGNALSAGDCAAASTDTLRARNCYSFYAYYAVPRTLLVTGKTSSSTGIDAPDGANRLSADPANDANVWVLMEYRSYFRTAGYSTSTSSGFTTGGMGRIVLDYVQPAAQSGTDKLFVGAEGTASTPVTSITINLAAQRQVGGQTVMVPARGRYSLTVYPRSIGSVQLNN